MRRVRLGIDGNGRPNPDPTVRRYRRLSERLPNRLTTIGTTLPICRDCRASEPALSVVEECLSDTISSVLSLERALESLP